jgi:PadR family transcriptional regulator, regulatory protein PadR
MSTKDEHNRIELLQDTLDLPILRTLRLGRAHGHAMAKAIERAAVRRIRPLLDRQHVV